MRIASLDTPVIVQKATRTVDGSGQAVTSFTDEATVWAKVEDTGASEAEEANRIQGLRSVRVTVRYYAGLTMRHRLLIGGLIHDITGIANVGRNEQTIINAVTREQ